MKLKIFLVLTMLLASFQTAFSATIENSSIYSLINSEEFTKLNEPILFEADTYFEDTEIDRAKIKYTWDFGNQNSDQGPKVVHRYQTPGQYRVTLESSYQDQKTLTIKDIFVSKANILLLTDQKSESESIKQFKKTAQSFDIYTNVISAYNSSTVFVTTELLSQKLPNKRSLINYQYVIDWTKDGISKQVLQKHLQKNNSSLKNATLILLNNFNTQLFNKQDKDKLGIQNVISVKKPALYTLLESNSYANFIDAITTQQHEYKIIDTNNIQSKLLPLSFVFNTLRSNGVNENSLYLLVIIPFLALAITFSKQIIGLEAIGFYTPLITTLSLLNLGFTTGTVIFILLYLFSYIAYKTITKIKLHYLAKNALIVSIFSLLAVLLITLLSHFSTTQVNIINLAIFPLVVLITVVESFAKQIYLKGYTSGSKKVFETFILCLATYFLAGGSIEIAQYSIRLNFIKNQLLQLPELNIILMLLIAYLGTWKGLKLTEYYNIRKYNSNIEE